MINASRIKLVDVLNKSVKYIIPENQRNFDWKKDQAEELWDDIQTGGTFLGTVVFDVAKESSDKEIIIVDGQQRITTIFILLAACRTHTEKIKSYGQKSAIENKISFIDDTTGKSLSGKLETSPSIREVFEQTIINSKWDGNDFNFKGKKRQVNRIRPIYEHFIKKIENYNDKKIAKLLENLYTCTFVQIDIEGAQEAFEIFERTNARGMELNAADLLKNYLFSRDASESLNEDWDKIVENSSGNILRMIKYFYVSKFGLVKRKSLFRKLRKYGDDIGADRLLELLSTFSYLYYVVVSGNNEDVISLGSEKKVKTFRKEYNSELINRSFDALKLFNVTQSYPLIIKFLEAIIKIKDKELKERSAKNFLRLIKSIETYHFVNNAICQRPGNEVEKYYADKCKNLNIEKELDLSIFIDEIIKEIKNKLVDKPEFIGRFREVNYDQDFYLIYYINDFLNNLNRQGGQVIHIYNPDKKFIRRNYNIDHLVSQDECKRINLDESLKHNIGNLLVVSYHTNSASNNKPLKEKIKIFKEKEVLDEVKEFVENWQSKKWEKVEDITNNIEKRSNDLAERTYKESIKKIK